MGADEGITLARPSQGSVDSVWKLEVLQPPVLLLGKLTVADLDGKLLGPFPRNLKRVTAWSAEELLGNAGIPDVMKVECAAVKLDQNAISAPCDVLVMKGLVHVADEMHDELGRLVPLPVWQLLIEELIGIVGESGDDAALVLAVALKVDIARVRRIVVGIDEVEVLGVTTPIGVAD